MSDTLRILQIAPRIPFPLEDGGRIGIYNITKHLALRGHEVTMLAFHLGSDIPDEVAQYARVIPVSHDTRTTTFRVLKNIFSPLPFTISKYQSEKMRDAARVACQAASYDVVHVDHLHLASYGVLLQSEFGLPYCLREHNFETNIYERFAGVQGVSLFKQYMKMQARRIRAYEAEQTALADVCMAITDEDAAQITAAGNANIRVVPAGVDLARHALLDRSKERPHSILLLGNLVWQPNADAARWFLKEIFPHVRNRFTDARVTIAGGSPPRDLLEQQCDSISFPGYVDDVSALAAEMEVLAIPLRVGGGMRIKMLEFFAFGKAVVSTTIGAEGNRALPGTHYLRADAPEEFATHIIAAMESAELRRSIGDAARAFVEEQYSWQSIAAQFETAYHEAIERRRTRR